MEQVCWAMIGCGSVTEKKSAPGLQKAERSRLVGVYSRHFEKAADYAVRHGVPKVYKTVSELLSDEAVNAVYIATPPDSHEAYALRCIERGLPVYIEKPLAPDYPACERILKAADAANVPAYVAFYRRGDPKFTRIRELLHSGEIGDVRFVEIRQLQTPRPCDLDREHLPWRLLPGVGGGKFMDLASHVLDYLTWFFGDIVEMTGEAANLGRLYPVEDTVSAAFRFENGALGNGMWCYVAGENADEVILHGSRGEMRFNTLFCGGDVEWTKDGERRSLHFDEPEHVQQALIQTIVDELTLHKKSPADAWSAARNIRMMDNILAPYRESVERSFSGA